MKDTKLLLLAIAVFLLFPCLVVSAATPSLIPLVGNYYHEPELSKLHEAIEQGADVNELGSGGTTPLIEAVNRNRPNSVKFLLENGADPDKCNAKRISPLAYAAMHDDAEVAVLLVEAGADVKAVSPDGKSILDWADLNFRDDFTLIDKLVEVGAHDEFFKPKIDPDDKDKKGETLLIKAVKAQKRSAVAHLIRRGADPNLKSDDQMTPLYAATSLEYGNSIRLVKRLVAAGAQINEPVAGGWTPLHKAAGKPDTDVTAFLLEHGAEVDARNDDLFTPLMCVKEKAENAILLIDAGADVKAAAQNGKTSLHYAAKQGNIDFALFLLEAGADINARDASGTTPLFSALEKRWWKKRLLGFIDFALDNGAEINALLSDGKNLLEAAEIHNSPSLISFLLERGTKCDLVATESTEIATQTLIFKAQKDDREALASCLAQTLEPVKETLIVNNEGENLLHYAARNCNYNLVKILLQKGFDPNSQRKKDGRTALHISVSSNSQDTIVELLKAGADPNLADSKGITASDHARRFGGRMIYEFLRHFTPEKPSEKPDTTLLSAVKRPDHDLALSALNYQPELEEADEEGRTPIFYVVKNDWHELAKRLLQMGARVDIADKKGVTPLHLAVEKGDRLLVKEMLKNKALVDAFTEDGETPLFWAARKNHTNLVDLLLKNGANLEQVDKKGQNALFYAYRSDYDLMTFAWLVKKGLAINATNKKGRTVFHEMMNPLRRLRQIKKAEKLGADWHIADNKGETPFSLALYGYSPELLDYVFATQPDLNRAKDQLGKVMQRWLVAKSYHLLTRAFAKGVSPDLVSQDGNSLLVEAISRNDFKAAGILLEAGADMGPVVVKALDLASDAIRNNKTERLKWLSEHHVDLNLQTEEGFSLLWLAVGRWEAFDLLLRLGVKPDVMELADDKLTGARTAMLGSSEGRERLRKLAGPEVKKLIFIGENEIERYKTIRDFISKGDLEGLKFSYETGFAVNARGYKGASLLHSAVLFNKLHIVKQLLEWGADIESENDAGLTPLQYAIDYKKNEIALFLLEAGADYKRKDKDTGASLIHFAAQKSVSAEVFARLIELGFSVNDRDNNGATPLLLAVEFGSDETVNYLLQIGADPNLATQVASSPRRTKFLHEKDPYFYKKNYLTRNWVLNGVTPLARAAFRGKDEIVAKLIEKGADLDAVDEFGNTALHCAVMGNSEKSLAILLAAGAKILLANRDGHTPLDLAENRHLFDFAAKIWLKVPLDVTHDPTKPFSGKDEPYALHEAVKNFERMHELRWIVRRGAGVNQLDREGHTPLWLAISKGYSKQIAVLLELGASPNQAGPDGETPWLKAFERSYGSDLPAQLASAGAIIDSADKNGNTALHRAAKNGFVREIEFLLKCGAKLDLRNQSGRTPLMEAILRKDNQTLHDEKVAMIKKIHEKRKKIFKKVPPWRRPRLPKIEKESDERKAVRLLTKKDPLYLNLQDNFGQTALHLAARQVVSYLIEDLVAAGADTEVLDREGRTPVFHAIATGNAENVETLLRLGAKPLVVDKKGESTVSLADSLGRDKILAILLKAGADRSFIVPDWPKIDDRGKTRLMRAVAENRFGAVKLLLEKGADPDQADSDGETSLFYAIRGCNYPMVELLLKNGADPLLQNLYEQNAAVFARQLSRETRWRGDLKVPPGFFPEQRKYADWQRIIKLLEGKK